MNSYIRCFLVAIFAVLSSNISHAQSEDNQTEDAQPEYIKNSVSKECQVSDGDGDIKSFATLTSCFAAGGKPAKGDADMLEKYAAWLTEGACGVGGNVATCGAAIREQLEATRTLEDANQVKENTKKMKEQTNIKEFGGFRLGVGIALAWTAQSIDKVSIENEEIVVNTSSRNRGQLMLEAHRFLWELRWPFENLELVKKLRKLTKPKQWGKDGERSSVVVGHGPFFAVTLTDEDGADPFSSYGVGWMAGWTQPDSPTSWNIGAGAFIDTKHQSLRDGLKDGMKTGETDPSKLLKKSSKTGFMLMFSSTW